MNIAVIFAGGIGSRMTATAMPKQFLEVHGKPIIIHTLEHFQDHPDIDAIAIAILPRYREHLSRLLKRYEITKVSWIVDGGGTGQQSRHRALQAVAEDSPSDSIVLIHDGGIVARAKHGGLRGAQSRGDTSDQPELAEL